VPSEDLPLLLAYSWPGNARELAAVMDRAVILGQGRRLEVAKALGMPLGPAESQTVPDVRPADTAARLPDRSGAVTPSSSLQPLDDAIRAHIERVLAATHGKIEGPAGAAGRQSAHTPRADA
jgi:DNA-binding NtrC family response regulator